eukprot:scaffold48446_cov68-Phaeocystis_antarctica.AAC.1
MCTLQPTDERWPSFRARVGKTGQAPPFKLQHTVKGEQYMCVRMCMCVTTRGASCGSARGPPSSRPRDARVSSRHAAQQICTSTSSTGLSAAAAASRDRCAALGPRIERRDKALELRPPPSCAGDGNHGNQHSRGHHEQRPPAHGAEPDEDIAG